MDKQEIECFCKSCNVHFLSKEKTIKEVVSDKVYEYSFQEEFCDRCLSKYVYNVDTLETKQYSHEDLTNDSFSKTKYNKMCY